MRKRRLALFSLVMFVFANIILQVSAQQATAHVYPGSQTVPNVNMNFIVNIMIENVTDLYAWGLKLYYPNDILNGTKVTEGPFLKTEEVSTFFLVNEFIDSYNNTHGRITALCTRMGPEARGVDGNGVLVTVEFNSKSVDGPKILHLEDVELSNSNVDPIPYVSIDGEVQVIPEFPTTLIIMLPVVLVSMFIVLRPARQPQQ